MIVQQQGRPKGAMEPLAQWQRLGYQCDFVTLALKSQKQSLRLLGLLPFQGDGTHIIPHTQGVASLCHWADCLLGFQPVWKGGKLQHRNIWLLGFGMIVQQQGHPKGAMEPLAQWQRLGFDMIVWGQSPCKGKSLVY